MSREVRFPQLLLDVHEELIVDLFAGGGGASLGIEFATGRQVDVAINHDAAAVAMHQANHPQTTHHVCDVFEVDPQEVAKGRLIGLLWASPDCTDHSKAKGGKPIRHKKRRALAWVVKRWAGQVRPRVIFLENVEEFVQWGPLVGKPGKLRRCEKRKGKTFRRFVRDLEGLGYQVEWRELRACDYGAPTIRKRLFLIARCDGQPIVWPEPTHGPGTREPYRTAAECIDWSIPMLSIFATPEEAKAWSKAQRAAGWKRMGTPKRPLAKNTMRRIAAGVVRYVLEAAEPFIVGVGGRQGQSPNRPTSAPYQTITAKADSVVVAPILTEHANASSQRNMAADEPLRTQMANVKGGHFALVAPYLIPRYGEREGQDPRTRRIDRPAPVVVPTGNGAQLVSAFLAKHFTGVVGSDLREPKGTVTTIDHDSLVSAHLLHQYTSNTNGGAGDPEQPAKTITTGGHHALVYSFLQKYYGQGVGQALDEPAATIPTKDRMGLVTVQVQGEPYVLVDIAMRMLQPRELYRAQGFTDDYVIDRGADGRRFTKTEQVRMVGNSVSPPQAAALVRANVPELAARDEVAHVA